MRKTQNFMVHFLDILCENQKCWALINCCPVSSTGQFVYKWD